MKKNIFVILLFILIFVINGCSKLNNNISAPTVESIVHGDGVVDVNSSNFHGKYLKGAQSFNPCQQCHGRNFLGGITGVSCVQCHDGIPVHDSTAILNPFLPTFHGKYITGIGWKLYDCSQCHGTDYAGGLVSPSCNNCHYQQKGPEACNTCHGDQNDTTRIAPPTSLSGDTSYTSRGVGAHLNHLYVTSIGDSVNCSECHIVPQYFYDPVHIRPNSNKAAINFGVLASHQTNNGTVIPNPQYNFSNGQCSNVYCHGYFKNGNLSNTVIWTGGQNEAKCGSCHGDVTTGNPIPTTVAQGGTHTTNQNCGNCHGDVVSVNGTTYTIINKAKHMNGKLNVFGTERDF